MFLLTFLLFLTPFLQKINLKYKFYPRWLRNKGGSAIECGKDEDCPFPSSCCNDPFFPSQYCCYGWNHRKLEYAYAYKTIGN